MALSVDMPGENLYTAHAQEDQNGIIPQSLESSESGSMDDKKEEEKKSDSDENILDDVELNFQHVHDWPEFAKEKKI